MATTWISDNMIWEVRTTGQPDNGGGWLDAGGASTDYTQQDAPEWSEDADLSSDVTGVIITSVAGGFTANMVGNLLRISGGNAAFVARWVEITGFTDANTITVKGNVGANKGLITGGDGRIGGALIQPQYAIANGTYGVRIHVKAGTYNATTSWTLPFAQAGNHGQILGYNASRGDSPRGNDRPLFNMGANRLSLSSHNDGKHLRLSGTSLVSVVGLSTYANLENIYVENTDAGANRKAIMGSSYHRFLDCEATCPNSSGGAGITAGSANHFISCYAHHCDVGISLNSAASTVFLHNIIANCGAHGLYVAPSAASYNFSVLLNTFYDNAIDIEVISNLANAFIWGNIFDDGTDGIIWYAAFDPVELDYNNFHGKAGSDVTNVTKGPHATAYDPLFETPGSDFRLQNASDCRNRVPSIFLAVGL